MLYLVRGRDRRADPRLVYPKAQSILCVALPYPAQPAGSHSPGEGVRYARYTRGIDYHSRMPGMLEDCLESVRAKLLAHGEPRLEWKVCVDTSALLERTWAALAGIGWIGKNGMLIHPKHGSYLLLGFALLDRKVENGPQPLPNFCGSCTRCLEGCPTQAFVAPTVVDAKKCISYWTLEKRGPLELDESQRRAMGNWVAGCDICQEVCPFNTKPTKAVTGLGAVEEGAAAVWRFDELLEESEESYRARIRDSSLNRVKPADFRRNLEIAIANSREESGKSRPD